MRVREPPLRLAALTRPAKAQSHVRLKKMG